MPAPASRTYGIWIEPIGAAAETDEPGFLTNCGRDLSYESYEHAAAEAETYRDDFAGIARLSVREKPTAAGIVLVAVGSGIYGKRMREAA